MTLENARPVHAMCVLRATCVALILIARSADADPARADVGEALADASRSEADRQRDAARKPEQLLAFAGLKAGDKIADFMPDRGYLSRIFCKLVGEAGHVYAISLPNAESAPAALASPDAEALAPACVNVTPITLQLKKKPAPELWSSSDDPGAVYEYWSFSPPAENFAAPEPLDVIWISGHYHDLPSAAFGSPNMQLVNLALWNSLKTGGVLIIEDHAAIARSGARDAATLHRIDPEHVKREVIAAGFEYVGASTALRRKDDPHTREAHAMGDASDRFVLKFRKPRVAK